MNKEVRDEDIFPVSMCKAYVSLSKLKNKFFLNGCHNSKILREELEYFEEEGIKTIYKCSYKWLKEQNLTDRFINELHTDNSDDDEEYKD